MPPVSASRVWSRAEEGERTLSTRPVSEGRQEGEVLQVEEASKVLPGVVGWPVEPNPGCGRLSLG